MELLLLVLLMQNTIPILGGVLLLSVTINAIAVIINITIITATIRATNISTGGDIIAAGTATAAAATAAAAILRRTAHLRVYRWRRTEGDRIRVGDKLLQLGVRVEGAVGRRELRPQLRGRVCAVR